MKRYVLSELDAHGVPIARDYSYQCHIPLHAPGSKYALCKCVLDHNHMSAIKKDARVLELGSLHENRVVPEQLADVYPQSGIVKGDTLHQALRKLTALHLDFEFDE